MKKWVVLLLVLVGIFVTGCSKEVEMSSLSEYEMVKAKEMSEQTIF